jgi:hypothetical protein
MLNNEPMCHLVVSMLPIEGSTGQAVNIANSRFPLSLPHKGLEH